MPLVQQRLRERSGRPVRTLEEPELAVVRGATALALGLVTPPPPPPPAGAPGAGPPEPEPLGRARS